MREARARRLAEAIDPAPEPPPAGDQSASTSQATPTMPTDALEATMGERLVTHAAADGATVDQFRKLAATLHYSQIEKGTRIVMVCSAAATEGKTSTALNLALTLATSYEKRVLFVDADLRRPNVHLLINVPLSPGLSDVLSGSTNTLPVVAIPPRLSVLTAGAWRRDPIHALSSERTRTLLTEAAGSYDWVIIDTSPAGMLPDANLLASIVDGAVLVVQSGAAPYTLVQRAAEAMGPDRILGVVLNRVHASDFTAVYHDQSYYQSDASR
jgi:capsular exopolysaccharide synthesis family protein